MNDKFLNHTNLPLAIVEEGPRVVVAVSQRTQVQQGILGSAICLLGMKIQKKN